MKLKLDENLGSRGVALLEEFGHDVQTVHAQRLSGAIDEALAAHCAEEGRALITLDLDFADPIRFPPTRFRGIAVLRLPGKATEELLFLLLKTLATALRNEQLDARLWIVEPHRIRVHEIPPHSDA